ncbi:MAG: hypothetical protein U0936_20745 [Planctomycetaceae bacterium]
MRTNSPETEYGGRVPVEPDTPLPGELNCRIVSRLGSGGMGTVAMPFTNVWGVKSLSGVLRPEIQKKESHRCCKRFDHPGHEQPRGLMALALLLKLDAREC